MNVYFKKNYLMKQKRFTNYSEVNQLELAYSYVFLGKKEYINPDKINENLMKSEVSLMIENKIIEFLKENENKIFFEKYNVYENVVVNMQTDERYWGYIRAGIISEDNNIYNISKPISCMEDLERLFFELCIMEKVLKRPCMVMPCNVTEKTVFYFEPQASAYIAHEVMGHCFEQDYYNMFTKNIFRQGSVIDSDCKFSFLECNQYKNNFFKRIDDIGDKVESNKMILHNGKIENLISSKRINDKDGSFRERMSCTVLKGKDDDYVFPKKEKYIHVYSIFSGFVNFEENKIVLLVNLAENVNGDMVERISMLPIQMPLESMFNGLIGMENNVNIYHNFCNKNSQVIDVFSGAPSIVMNGFSLLH